MAKYKELEIMSYAESCALERKPLGPGMYLTLEFLAAKLLLRDERDYR